VPRIINTVGAHAKVVEQLGGYEDDTNPSFAMLFPDGEDPQKIFDAMYMTGYALSQDSMLALSSKEFKGSFPVDLITLPTDSDPDAVHELYTKIRKATDNVVEGHTTIGNEMMIMVDAGTGEKLGKIIDSLTPAEHDVGVADGHAAFPEKKDYDYGSDQGQTSQLAGRRDDARKYRSEASARLEAELRKGKSRKTKRQLVWRPDREVIRQLLIQPRWRPLDLISRDTFVKVDTCGAGSPGGGGFSEGNTCATGKGGGDRSSTKYFKQKQVIEGVKGEWVDGEYQGDRPSVFEVANHLEGDNSEVELDYENIPPGKQEKHLKAQAEAKKKNTESATIIGQAMADEIKHAIEWNKEQGLPSGEKWYNEQTAASMKLMGKLHPELLTDESARNAFKAILAITSNNQEVVDNFALADELYRKYKDSKDGTFPVEFNKGGKSRTSMQKHFAILNKLVASDLTKLDGITETGWGGVQQFMKKEFRFGDLQDAGLSVVGEELSGELVDTRVKGAVIFGPKIGSFYGNMTGDYSSITMDLWWTRGFTRLAGTTTNPNLSLIKAQSKQLYEELEDLPDDHGYFAEIPKADLLNELEFAMAEPNRVTEQRALGWWVDKRNSEYEWSRPEWIEGEGEYEEGRGPNDPRIGKSGNQLPVQEKYGSFADRTVINKVSKSLNDNLFPMRDAPKGGGEREWMREAMAVALAELKKQGIDITPADAQAVLWYQEKRLYQQFGYNARGSEVKDYVDGAKAVLEKYGMSE